MKKLVFIALAILVLLSACPGGNNPTGSTGGGTGSVTTPMKNDAKVIFLPHSTGGIIWKGGVKTKFDTDVAAKGKAYTIEKRAYPDGGYPWKNYPYDYWLIWVKNGGAEKYSNQDTLKKLTKDYDVIVWKHCYPVTEIGPDSGTANVEAEAKQVQHYKLQYEALKAEMKKYPNNRFIVWTGAARVNGASAQNERARDFFKWVRNVWDEPNDNIYIWDFWTLETGSEDGTNLKVGNANSASDSHPSETFAKTVAPKFVKRVIDVIEGRGDTASILGE